MPRIQVKHISLDYERPSGYVSVLIVQPKVTPEDFIERDDLYYWRDASVPERYIHSILALSIAEKSHVIILPEISVPLSCLNILEAFSEEFGCVIIAGSHYYRAPGRKTVVSRCPIITTKGTYFTEKINPSPMEHSALLGSGLAPGTKVLVLENSIVGNFAVTICSDFLASDLRQMLLQEDLDILFVPAFQRDSIHYHTLMSHTVRHHKRGIYIVYANMLCAPWADGRSAIFGQIHNMYKAELQRHSLSDFDPECKVAELPETESFLAVSLDLEVRRPLAANTAQTRPNIKLERFSAPVRSEGPFKLVAFDLDGTLLRGFRFSWTVVWEAIKKSDIGRALMRDFLAERIDYATWCRNCVDWFSRAGVDRSYLRELADTVTVTNNLEVAIQRIKQAGLSIILVSGGIDTFLYDKIPAADDLFDRVYINRLLFDGGGRLVDIVPTSYDFRAKLTAIEETCYELGADVDQAIFVGDAFQDQFVASSVGYSIAYPPNSALFKESAHLSITEDDLLVVAQAIESLLAEAER